MPELTLFNAGGRDAQVSAESIRLPIRIRRLDRDGKQCQCMRILRGTFNRGLSSLVGVPGNLGPTSEQVSDMLIAGDPEIDLETVGMFLRPGESKRVYVDAGGKVQHVVQHMEIVRNPDGSEKERRVKGLHAANVHIPLRWSGKLIPRKEAIAKYVFSGKRQIRHINGLTYDFLFDIAAELDKANSMLLVGAGPKGNQPLVLRRGAVPYRGFLEGRVREQEYLLLLHLSNLELKSPVAQELKEAAA
jgi:hypothetical protein